MSEYAVRIYWYDELREHFDDWTNHGRNIAEEKCTHKDRDSSADPKNRETNMRYGGYCEKCGFSEDSQQPMMNYGYPLDRVPDESAILQIIKHTNLTVMEHEKNGNVYLVLCGGGMDLSQDIAYAYLLAGERIPAALAASVSTQEGLNHSGATFKKIMRGCIESLESEGKQFLNQAGYIKESMKKKPQQSQHI